MSLHSEAHISKHRWTRPSCSQSLLPMSSVFRRPGSPFWFAAYRAADGRRQKKPTKQVGKARAEAVLAQLVEAERLAAQKIMTEAQGRRSVAEIVERTTGTSIQFHTCREWLEEWCASKTGAISERTLMKYKQITRDFLNHLGDRAELALAAVTPRDVRSFRDAMVGHGHAPSTINQTVRKILSAPFLAAQRLGCSRQCELARASEIFLETGGRTAFACPPAGLSDA